jgi:CheY-like chemotaxis protein
MSSWLNIKAKLILVLVSVGLIPLFAVSWFVLEQSRETISRDVFNHLISVRDGKLSQIKLLDRRVKSDIKVLAQSPHMGAALDAFSSAVQGGEIDLEQFNYFESIEYGASFSFFLKEYGYYDLMLVTLDGDIVYSTKRESDLGQNLFAPPLAKSQLAKWLERGFEKSAITDFQIYGPSGGHVISFLIAPIDQGSGTIGAVVLKMTNRALNEIMLERSGMGKSGETYLVGPDNLMRSDSYLDRNNRSVSASFENPTLGSVKTNASQAALEGKTGRAIHTDYRDVSVLSAYLPVKFGAATYALVAEIDESEAFESIEKLQYLVIVMAAGVALLMLILAYVIANIVTRPILSLTQSSIEIANGNLDQKVEIQRDDELGMLSENFDKMRLSIRAKILEVEENRETLRRNNETLEVRVEGRTRELEAALIVAEEATEAKAQFLANMSHEIRTPMNAIIGLSNLALETELSEKQKDYLTKIEGSGKALLGIINDILDFSKIEAGKLAMEEIAFDLHSDVLENLSSVIGMKAAEQGLELLYDFDADLPAALVGDPLRLGQILINLGNNAIKFTEQGEITLAIEVSSQDDDQVFLRVEVRDTGIGMTKEQTDKLFQAFSQADSTTTRKFGGTGLGLTISKSLVELMDGEIGVESEAGKGSTFWFTARFGRASEEEVKERRQLDIDLKGLKVLVVDDNPTARTILSRYLQAFEYDVAEAASGAEAIGVLEMAPENAQFDLVLMDWKMPTMDGLEATRRIKSDDKLSSVPAVMMVTAYDREQLEEEASGTKYEGVLVKPVSQSSLLDGILMAFGKELGVREHRKSQSLPAHCLGARILLVEDNDINQQVAIEILEKAGCEVTLAVDGREGVKAAQERPDYYDCILMDIQMPVLDGYGATREIRQDASLDNVPVIAMTANAFSSDREKALEVGMVDHVAKPIEVRNLFDVMGQWITVPEDRRGSYEEKTDADVETTPSLPDLPGIDTKVALERLGGNTGLYISLLQGFVQQQATSNKTILTALSADDHVLAEREAHTVKGVAANLGMEALFKVSGALEAAIQAGDKGAIDESHSHFTHELETTLQSIKTAFPELPEAGDLPVISGDEDLAGKTEDDARLILVAEDSVINQKIIGRQLSLVGYESEMAIDGKVALELLATRSYGILLTDLSMPEVDGYELATRIREMENGGSARLPIIAITGSLSEVEIARCKSVGMDDCLAKPIYMDELKRVLKEHFPEGAAGQEADTAL